MKKTAAKSQKTGQLIVRKVDEKLIRALKQRAAKNHRSAEAEHREILREALESRKPRRSFEEVLFSMPDVGEDSDFERQDDYGREIDL
jgi:plasmid stability protein